MGGDSIPLDTTPTRELALAEISGCHERERGLLAAAATERAAKIGYIHDAIAAGRVSVIEVADTLGVHRQAVYKMLRTREAA